MFPVQLNSLTGSERAAVRRSALPGAPTANFDPSDRISEINAVAIPVIQMMRQFGFGVLAPVSQSKEHELFDQVVRELIKGEPKSIGLSIDDQCLVQDCVQSFRCV